MIGVVVGVVVAALVGLLRGAVSARKRKTGRVVVLFPRGDDP